LEADDAEKMVRLLERLEDLDDVQQVYSNAEISEDVLAGIA
jgi:transcriptional/translational regulatory protein YebC/TACO1